MNQKTIDALLEIRSERRKLTNPPVSFRINDLQITLLGGGKEAWLKGLTPGNVLSLELVNLDVSSVFFSLDSDPEYALQVCFESPVLIESILGIGDSPLINSLTPTTEDFKDFNVLNFTLTKGMLLHNEKGPCDGHIGDITKPILSYALDDKYVTEFTIKQLINKNALAQKLKAL